MEMEKEFHKLQDTIVSIATFPAAAAIGIVKLSGKKSVDIVKKIFKPAKKKDLKKVASHTVHYGMIVDGDTLVDEVLVTVMRAPNTHTREDVVEISSHSGQYVMQRILRLCCDHGARIAEPGEFTRRAFLNGRIDLVQAEAVLDVIHARSEEALRLGTAQLAGRLSRRLDVLAGTLDDVCAHLEAELSFPEDTRTDLSLVDRGSRKALEDIDDLLTGSDAARCFREGLRCVIAGGTNVGKSSLLNMLLEEERVIVSDVAGTTRDVIEESINIRGIALNIYDTAGILRPRDLIEEKAIGKSLTHIDNADIVICVLDSSRSLSSDDRLVLDRIKGRNAIIVCNKSDLPPAFDRAALKSYGVPVVSISALHRRGLRAFENAVVKAAGAGDLPADRDVFVSNIRHIELLGNARRHLEQGRELLSEETGVDSAYFHFREARACVAGIMGRAGAADILERVFSRFCIGK